jgi:CubicO group peptidase (beta-lactamase class C family)
MMPAFRILVLLTILLVTGCLASNPSNRSAGPVNDPRWAPVAAAMRHAIEEQQISGAVTLIADKDNVLAFEATGLADVSANKPMRTDTIFAIASMTKLVTAVAVMMLEDDGKLSVDDPVGKYIPELSHLKTADGKEHVVALRHMLTHTSGMAEVTPEQSKAAKTLADLIPPYAAQPLVFAPGTQWKYCQSGINTLGRIVEVVSGQAFTDFLQKRIFDPLEMKDTTFYPTKEQAARVARMYKRQQGKLIEMPLSARLEDPEKHDYFPAANGGLYSTAGDYVRLCQMVLNHGSFAGRQYLKPQTVNRMTTSLTGEMDTLIPGAGWGLGWAVVRDPKLTTTTLPIGAAGHGGAFGTLAWVDFKNGFVYVLMVQRGDFSDKLPGNARTEFLQAVKSSREAK